MDDILEHAPTQEAHDLALEAVLQRLQSAGVTLNKQKCQFSVPRVKYLGHVVSHSGIQPDPDKVSAIHNFSTPQNITDIQRFLGMINQLAKFVPHVATITKPIRDLLVKQNEWIWGAAQENSFKKLKVLNPYSETLHFLQI